MFTVIFKKPTRIDDEIQLRKLFKTDRISLEKSASVIFEGVITLGTEIVFSGDCKLEDGNLVNNGCAITNVALGPGNNVRHYSILSNIKAGKSNVFGPFCFIRDGCIIADDCILGSHVETARCVFASGVKISHHAFVGDAIIGERTIIGAGTVFCNFDGKLRQVTRVGSEVIIGSGVLLIAPLSVGDSTILAAGSTVTKDVPRGTKIIQRRR